MIPEAAVEAALHASFLRHDWGDEHYRKLIERALEAAAPHILARGWDEGRTHGATFPYGERGLATDDNPYRTTK